METTYRRRSLLLVEDDPSSRSILSKVFTLRGWLVTTSATIDDALHHLHPVPDCVILDLMLPDGPGETVLRAIRGRQIATRVVVATGVDSDDRIREVRRLGADEVVMKPWSVREICAACLD